MSVLIIGEAGVNHNGKMSLAKKLVDVAQQTKVDFVKFQTFKVENVISKHAKKALYQKKNTDSKSSLYEMLKPLELSFNQFIELKQYCIKSKIEFLSTPHDLESIEFLNKLGQKYFKIASGDINNYPMLKEISSLKQNVILSTGMSDLNEIDKALNVLSKNGLSNSKITLLHCTTEYPTPINDINLNAMVFMKDHFKLRVGFSDHSLGFEASISAVALGAEVIEKHFTTSKKLKGPDHLASLEPNELKKFVIKIRNTEKLLGNKIKKPSSAELKNLNKIRKSIVASKEIKKGELFTLQNISVKRPGNGVSPMMWEKIIGIKSDRNYELDDQIKFPKNSTSK